MEALERVYFVFSWEVTMASWIKRGCSQALRRNKTLERQSKDGYSRGEGGAPQQKYLKATQYGG